MSNTIITVENISKSYVLQHQKIRHNDSFREHITNNIKSIFKKKDADQSASQETFWALNDVSFDINQGDRVGIIGRNGAGKSTLLKILSRIVTPTHGRIKIEGRVASLLEVGTGFHPELSGRENVFLNGSILGMSKNEIQKKFDEIVAFAEVERFLDTPVKRYSSGMYVRLAFAVAAHLEPEILIVDEVLAVGDAEFQKKCLGKMKDVSGEGRTVIFVSHNMAAVKALCNKGILLHNGSIKIIGSATHAIENYLKTGINTSSHFDCSDYVYGDDIIRVLKIEILNGFNNTNQIKFDENIKIKFKIDSKQDFENISVAIGCLSIDEIPVFTTRGPVSIVKGENEIICEVKHNLRANNYHFAFGISVGEKSNIYHNPNAFDIEILDIGNNTQYLTNNAGFVNVNSSWQIV